MSIRSLVFCLSIFLCSFCGLKAQYYPVLKFTVKEGLPHSNIFRIYQDTRGFLWLSTDYGLSRYDGREFVNFLSADNTLSDRILSAVESPQGGMLMCTFGGGMQYLDKDTIRPFVLNKQLPKEMLYCNFDKKGVWFIPRAGELYRWEGGRLSKCCGKDGGPFFRRMLGTEEGIVFATDNGLYISRHYENPVPFLAASIFEHVYAIDKDSDNCLWVALKDKVLKIRNDSIAGSYSIGDNNDISDLLVDHNGNAWVSIPSKGILLKKAGGSAFIDITDKLQLSRILVNDLFEDRSGNIWIGTHGSGLFCVQSLNILTFPVQEGLVNNYCKAINRSDGKMYFASIGTLSTYQPEELASHTPRNISKIDFIYFISINKDSIYIGTPDKLIIKEIKAPYAETVIRANGCISFFQRADGSAFIGGYSGLFCLNHNRLYRVNEPLLNRRRINKIVQNRQGCIYFGTDSGIVCLKEAGYSYLKIPGSAAPINVNDILCDKNGGLWIASENGVFHVTAGKGSYVPFLNGSTLSRMRATVIGEDRKGNIWVGSLFGLWRYKNKVLSRSVTGLEVISNEIQSIYCDEANNLWVGTVNGIYKISEKESHKRREPPKVYITELLAEKTRILFPQFASLRLPANIQVRFSGIELPSSQHIEYEYCLSGRGHDWYSTANNAIELSSLPQGNYVLQVRARRPGEAWGSPALLNIEITVPFWRSSWFLSLEIIGALFLLLLLVRVWFQRVDAKKKKEAAIQEKMIHLKQQALAALINPHFVFNCLNSIQTYIQLNNKQLAIKYLVQFSQLIRITLDHAQETFISLEKEIERLDLYLQMQKLRFEEKLEYRIEVDPLLQLNIVQIPNMVLQPYIENSIKHGIMPKKQGGTVSIGFYSKENNAVEVIIEDDGLGIDFTNSLKNDPGHHRSLGMNLTSERLQTLEKMHNRTFRVSISELKDDESRPAGTRVVFIFDHEVEPSQAVN